MRTAWTTLLAWLFGPPAVAASTILLGDMGALGWPPEPSGWARWLGATEPAVAIAATLRLALVIACALTSLQVIIVTAATLFSVPPGPTKRTSAVSRSLRRALGRIARPAATVGLGVSLVSSSAMATVVAATPRQGPHPTDEWLRSDATTHSGPADSGNPGAVEVAPGPGDAFAEMRRVRIDLAPLTDSGSDGVSRHDVWVVEPGDHLWGIAVATLTEHLGEAPNDRRLTRYWQRLIEANRDRLVIPGDPDVIMPGQRLLVPRPLSGADQRSGT